jgi:hypothetical protein
VREGGIAPKLQAVDGPNGSGQFDALAGDLAGNVHGGRIHRDEDVTLRDVVSGDGPLRPAVPQRLLGPVSDILVLVNCSVAGVTEKTAAPAGL